jgi:hypothetical protein
MFHILEAQGTCRMKIQPSTAPEFAPRFAPKFARLFMLCCVAAGSSAHAQFADRLKNAVASATTSAVASAAGNAAGKATTEVLNGGTRQPAQARVQARPVAQPYSATASTVGTADPAARPGCPSTRAVPMAPLGSRPGTFLPEILWPEEPACGAYKFTDLKFDAARAQRRIFTEASAVPCGDCEGGKAYDAWAHDFVVKGGNGSRQFEQMLIDLKPGDSIEWKGARFSGRIELAGEHPIGDYPCKQFHWTLRDKANQIAAERPGLFCQWRGEYSASAKWQEVL